ncbi:MAG: ETC complex I subunit [Pseudorhodoplanes sp.]
MVARIYKPARTAMQSGSAKTKDWVLDYEPAEPRAIEPLMGWTSSTDMKSQVRLRFETAEEAQAYCERHGIPYQISQPKEPSRRKIAYSDNFAFTRQGMWTH